jgi:hypothetical protein
MGPIISSSRVREAEEGMFAEIFLVAFDVIPHEMVLVLSFQLPSWDKVVKGTTMNG